MFCSKSFVKTALIYIFVTLFPTTCISCSTIGKFSVLNLGAVYMERGRSQKADHSSAICFLYSVYMQRVVIVPSARIFLVRGSSYLSARKIQVLGRSQHHINCFRQEDPSTRDKRDKNVGGSFSSLANYVHKGRPFRLE